MLTTFHAFAEAQRFISTSVKQIPAMAKPRMKFLSTMVETLLTLPGRFNFTNLSRYSGYSEKAIRLQMGRRFNFFDSMMRLCLG